jgi:hypothetical protein
MTAEITCQATDTVNIAALGALLQFFVECKAFVDGSTVTIRIKNPKRKGYAKSKRREYAKWPLAIIHCNDPEQAQRIAERVNGDE